MEKQEMRKMIIGNNKSNQEMERSHKNENDRANFNFDGTYYLKISCAKF
jgi:cytoplasmic iron level regulating protein YaaA (DUF328/UPF0246 family)